MSCTPDESVYTNNSLSPSEESRFVPRQTITIMEGHFASTPQAKPPVLNHDEPSLVADDEKSGIVGATICFTPQPSPSGTPPIDLAPLMNSVETEEYIGSIDVGKDKSSLTGADFELLDGIESNNGSIKVEDLDVDEDVVDDVLKETAKAMKNDTAADDSSPPSDVPSLSNDEAAAGKEDKKPPATPVVNEDSLLYSDDTTGFSRMTKSMLSHMAKLGKEDAVPSSPKVDATPISTLKTLKAFWENRVLGKATEETQGADGASSNASDHQSVSNSVASSHASLKPKSSFVSSICVAIWLWIQSVLLVCAFSVKKVMEQICNALARNIISTAAGRADGTTEDESDDIDLEEVVGTTRRNLGALFSDGDASTEAKADPTAAGEADDSSEGAASTSPANPTTSDWKSRAAQVIALIIFVLRLVFHLFGAIITSGSDDSEDEVCLTTNTTSFDSVPAWEADLAKPDATHIQMFIGSNIPLLSFMATVTIAMILAYFYKPDLIKKLSIKKQPKHLTGLWTAKEHEQFIKGFDQYGSNWKMVAPFIPTRDYEQVKAHGIHWKKIGSPDTMKRSKKIKVEASATPVTIVSDALAQLTPKASNIANAITKTSSKSKEDQLARARQYAQGLKKGQTAKKDAKKKAKGSSRYSL